MIRLIASNPARNGAIVCAQRTVTTQSVMIGQIGANPAMFSSVINIDKPQELNMFPEASKGLGVVAFLLDTASTLIPSLPKNRAEAINLSLYQKYSSLANEQRTAVNEFLTNTEVLDWFRRTETKRIPVEIDNVKLTVPIPHKVRPAGKVDRKQALAIVANPYYYGNLVADLRAHVVEQLTTPEVVQWYKQGTKRAGYPSPEVSVATPETAPQKAKLEELGGIPPMSRNAALIYIQEVAFASTSAEMMKAVTKELTVPEVVAWHRRGIVGSFNF